MRDKSQSMTENNLILKESAEDDQDVWKPRVSNRATGPPNKFRMKTSLEDLQSLMFWKAQFAEFVGTFLLVLTAVGSTVQDWSPDELDVVQIAFSFGLCVATAIWIVGHISGGHVNPAVTIAMFITRKISLVKAVLYIITQCIASITAAALLRALTPASQRGSLGCTTLGKEMTTNQGVVIELFITLLLVLTVFASCDKNRKDLGGSFPLTIGLSVTVAHLWAVEFTGSSMNPARSLGPAVVMNIWADHWIYWVGPMSGGIIAGLLYDNLLAPNASLLKARNCLLASDFDEESFKARKKKVLVLEEEDEEDNTGDENKECGSTNV